MVAYYLKKKWDFDSKDSKWIFEIHFKEEHFEKKVSFKKKEKLLKRKKRMIYKGQYSSIRHRQPKKKTKSQNKVLDNHAD